MIPQSKPKPKKNSSKVNLTISFIFHALLIGVMIYFAAREGYLGKKLKEITVYNDGVNTGPTGIAFDASGNVYISEFYSGTAVKYAPGNGATPLMVLSQGTASCEGIAVDKAGNIYVSNSGLNTITVYSPAGGAPIRTLN